MILAFKYSIKTNSQPHIEVGSSFLYGFNAMWIIPRARKRSPDGEGELRSWDIRDRRSGMYLPRVAWS